MDRQKISSWSHFPRLLCVLLSLYYISSYHMFKFGQGLRRAKEPIAVAPSFLSYSIGDACLVNSVGNSMLVIARMRRPVTSPAPIRDSETKREKKSFLKMFQRLTLSTFSQRQQTHAVKILAIQIPKSNKSCGKVQ